MRLHNTLTRQIDDFKPASGNRVKLYACGLTVYSQPHIGNWVAYIYWDILVRTLRASGFEVDHVQNITDVGHLTSDEDAGEDKMLKGALKEGKTAWEVADKYIGIADHEAYDLLGLTRPTHMPRATEYIDQQKAFVEELQNKGYTYVIEDGIYFDTSKLEHYGELARLDIEGLRFGARVEDTGKKNPTDFAVWKFSSPNEKRDMEWDSPVDPSKKGFPGWHLECSVMARELLGDQIDIHTGGIDHIPVHHTNEIAQTEAITNKQFSQFWVHANHIKVNGTKISKSLGNGFTLQDILDKGYDLQAFKLMVLGKHYQTEGNFTWENLEAAQNRIRGIYSMSDLIFQPIDGQYDGIVEEDFDAYKVKMLDALNNNLDTPSIITLLSTLESDMFHFLLHVSQAKHFRELLNYIDSVLGLGLSKRKDITDDQKRLIKDRESARDAKDWAMSDQIRDQLKEQGLELNDTPNGTIWSRI